MLTLASAPLCKDEIVKFERAVCISPSEGNAQLPAQLPAGQLPQQRPAAKINEVHTRQISMAAAC